MKKYISLIPTGILAASQLYSLYVINTTNIIWGSKQYAGAVFCIIIIALLLLKKRTWAIYLAGISLLLGAFNLIAFLPVIESYSLGFSLNNGLSVNLKIQVFSFVVLIIYLILDYKIIFRTDRHDREE